jgi:hypothetical protein
MWNCGGIGKDGNGKDTGIIIVEDGKKLKCIKEKQDK